MMEEIHKYKFKMLVFLTILWETVFWIAFFGLYFYLIERAEAFRFEHIKLLWGLISVPFLVLGYLLLVGWKNRALKELADEHLLKHLTQPVSSLKSFFKFFFFRNAVAFLIIALANPQFGKGNNETVSEGIEIMLALDISNSMRALDLDPEKDRLKVAKMAIEQLLNELHGDKVGLVLFAGDAFVQVPLTIDYGVTKLFLNDVSPEMISKQGTAIGLAIEKCMNAFDLENEVNKAIIVLSDGEDHQGDAINKAQLAVKENITISTVGMGTTMGTPIPDYKNGKRIGMKKDQDGNTVTTRLNQDMLTNIAKEGGGTYSAAKGTYLNLDELLKSIREIDKSEMDSQIYTDYKDYFHWFLGLGLLFLLIETIITEKRSGIFYKLQKL